MSLPTPQFALDGCTALFDNTLYSFSAGGFQSLELKGGARWSQLPTGVPVDGGVCVQAIPKDDTKPPALYIVGGTSNSSDYSGLQRYRFGDRTWESLMPTVLVTQNRLYHGAVYLDASDIILIYAGSQDGVQYPSTQTFTIAASEPYAVLAYESTAPPALNPNLMAWSDTDAAYIGESGGNNKVMQFNPATAWLDSGISLLEPSRNTTTEKSIILQGDDGSKVLYTFDMSISPNAVHRTVLVDENGQALPTASPASRRDVASTRLVNQRDLLVADSPEYNDTFVSLTTRESYSLAHDRNGQVVISGGNVDDVLCIFDAKENSWTSAQHLLGVTSTEDLTATTASGSPTSTINPKIDGVGGGSGVSRKVLAAVLASVIGAIVLLAVALVWIRRRRKRLAGHVRRSSGLPSEKYNESFSDAMNLSRRSGTGRPYRGHTQQNSNTSIRSFSSMAILMGRKVHKRKDKHGSHGSAISSQFNNKYRNAISNPVPHGLASYSFEPEKGRPVKKVSPGAKWAPSGRPRVDKAKVCGSRRRSSGWNRYWSGGSSVNAVNVSASNRNTVESDAPSEYSETRELSRISQGPTTVPPPIFNGRTGLNEVNSSSPRVEHIQDGYREMSGTIERHQSTSSAASGHLDDEKDAYSSGIPSSIVNPKSWLPPERHDWDSLRNLYSQGRVDTNGKPSSQPPKSEQVASLTSDMSWLNLGGESRQ